MASIDSIIQTKNSGNSFSKSQIQEVVNGFTSGDISDDSMTHWLQAVFEMGMNHAETLEYTKVMLNSGVTLDFSHLDGFVIDKHSTGGVGDKVSLILGPLLASCGCYVPMLAGRGLAHTGGTIDKLESIVGYKTALSLSNFQRVVEKVGVSMIEQTAEICPADGKIYALRDVTNTVASNPLICGSIMSKKIAEGIQGLVLDIKVGNGAFMKTLSAARELGELLKTVGEQYGLKVSTVFTDMNQPLGKSAGLHCEIVEAVECLKGNGPTDLMEVVYNLGEEALKIAGIENPSRVLTSNIENGTAFEKFEEMVVAHGGAFESIADPSIHVPKYKQKIFAEKSGYISGFNTLELGKVIVQLGGGRVYKDDILDPTVGIIFHKKVGDSVNTGEVILEYFCSNPNKIEKAKFLLKTIFTVQPNKPTIPILIY